MYEFQLQLQLQNFFSTLEILFNNKAWYITQDYIKISITTVSGDPY